MNLKSASEIFKELNITEEEYMTALQISDDQDFQLHLKRPTDFDIGLLVRRLM